MSQSSWNPDEQISVYASFLRSDHPDAPPERVVEMMLGRAKRVRSAVRFRVRMIAGLTLGVAVTSIATVALWPQRAMASLSEVTKATKGQTVYYYRNYSWNKFKGIEELEGNLQCWQLRDRQVSSNSWRRTARKYLPQGKLEDYPFFESTLWIYKNGRVITSNPQFPKAVEYEEGISTFLPAPTLPKVTSTGQIVESTPRVRAHGGLYDRYVLNTPTPAGTCREVIYADPSTHLIRFFDTPRQSKRHLNVQTDPETGQAVFVPSKSPDDWFETSIEYRYPGESQLEREVPKPPSGDRLVRAGELRAEFMKTIAQPVDSKLVGGIRKTLYGVIIRAPGDIYAITRGGAPRDEDSPQEVQVVGSPSREFETQPRFVSSPLTMPRPKGGIQHFLFPRKIAGREYLIETTRQIVLGELPRRITIKVPVWRYDYAHPVHTLFSRHPRVYPSKFVGYATFTTDKIYALPGGIANGQGGADFPSDF